MNFADPFRKTQRAGAEHLPIVDLLKRLTIALIARDLANEQDHRRAVLKRGVHADARIGGARPASDEADAGSSAELALRLGHEGSAALLPARDETDAISMLVEAVERREV